LSSGRSNELSKQKLLNWYYASARDLPWRHTSDPYAVWVSEIMLQQTQVVTVIPRFLDWMQRFDDVESLADAEPDAVMKAWEGLGYYRRARFLHAAAGQIMYRHGGRFPDHFDDMLALPGIGRSTAGAISSICFGAHTPVLDGNVKRVLSRWHASPDATETELWRLAQDAIQSQGDPGQWNQAMMELGARICLPRRPECVACPVHTHCALAFSPVEKKQTNRVAVRDVHWRVHLHLDGSNAVWLQQRPGDGIWGGLWSPPVTELGRKPSKKPCHIHQLTHRRLHLYSHISKSMPEGEGRWAEALNDVAVPTGMRRLLQKHGMRA